MSNNNYIANNINIFNLISSRQHIKINNGDDCTVGLNDFIITKERSLPIFILADTSGSMDGTKILSLNKAIQEMITTLRNVEDIRGSFKVSIITFGNKVVVQQYPTDVEEIEFKELVAGGKTPMGEALGVITDIIEDRKIVNSKDFLPTIVLLSDGQPTDFSGGQIASLNDYLLWEPIKKLHNSPRSSKCLRVAISVGEGTDLNMLSAFLNNGTAPMMANDANEIAKLFNWITMSTVSRMSSLNPDDIQSFLKFDSDFEDDEIII